MNFENNISLKPFNTFGVDVIAEQFVSIHDEEMLEKIISKNGTQPLFIIGGGSNMLLTKDVNCLVVHINLKGISVVFEDNDFVQVKSAAGENWHDFVLWCLDRNYGGIENLALIPGSVGAAPIQNIGAYGVELKDVFVSCDAINKYSGEKKRFVRNNCDFGYRQSIFKGIEKGKWIITSVTFELSKTNHRLKTTYGAIQEHLDDMNIKEPSIRDIAQVVIGIRSTKLPDPKVLGNSGSFFKNPVVEKFKKDSLCIENADMPFFELTPETYKIPAAWLIEQSGFKGKRYGDCGVHNKQALVIVNYGNATGKEIFELASTIQNEVESKFGIRLEMEVNIL